MAAVLSSYLGFGETSFYTIFFLFFTFNLSLVQTVSIFLNQNRTRLNVLFFIFELVCLDFFLFWFSFSIIFYWFF